MPLNKIDLYRWCHSEEMGAFGTLKYMSLECFTVERPWLDNTPCESCIPVGVYEFKIGRYNRGGYPAVEILDVPGRTLIKIHKGNTMDDLLGCIAPGTQLGVINKKWAVLNSTIAFNKLMALLEGVDGGVIHIHN